MPFLPIFSLDRENHSVTAESGREDKIELSLGLWHFQADTETADGIRNFLAAPSNEHLDAFGVTGENSCGPLFNQPHRVGTKRLPMKFRVRPLLFSGEWDFAYSGGGDAPRAFETRLNLSLNPLRYLRYNAAPRMMLQAHPDNWPAPRLRSESGTTENQSEFALDGKDNWLPDDPYFARWSNPERWRAHLRKYVRGVGKAFDDELRRVCEGQLTPVNHTEHFKLQKVETTWEFAATEPIELVRNLIPHLREYRGLDCETRYYRAPVEAREVNSLSFKMRLSKDVALRLYAKTNRRIRFEIIYEKINHRELLDEPQRNRGAHMAEPLRPWNQIFDCLDVLREKAAERLNHVLAFVGQRTRVVGPQVSGFALLITIASAVQNPGLAHTVLSLLLDGAITARAAGAPLLDACRRLAGAGILEYDSGGGVYRITPYYEPTLKILRTIPKGRILTRVRYRQRPPAI